MTAFLTDFLFTLAGISISMALVTSVLLPARNFMKKHFTASCRYLIWCLVILRLLVPLGGIYVPSIISISQSTESSSPIKEDFSYVSPIENKGSGVMAMPEVEIPLRGNAESEISASQISDLSKDEVKNESSLHSFSITLSDKFVYCIAAVWAIGAIIFLARYGICYAVSCNRIKIAAHSPDEHLKNIFECKCFEMNIRRIPRLVVSEAVDSPMLYGFFRPTVVMPTLILEDRAAECVIAHELTHYRRGDLYVKLASMIGNSIHWFNPAAYISCKALSSEMELSCDEKVLKFFSDEERVSYGQTMLDIVKNCKRSAPSLSTGFNPAANAIKERLLNILDSEKKGKGISVICLTLVMCILSGSFLGYEVSAIELPLPNININSEVSDTSSEVTVPETESSEVESLPLEAEITVPETTADTPETTKAEETTTVKETTDGIKSEESSHRTEVIIPVVSEETTEKQSPALPHTHSYTVAKTPPTCSSHGYNLYSCSCGNTYTTLVNRTHAHSTRYVEKTVISDGEEMTYNAEICEDCGIEVCYKKSLWDGTTVSYYISGPFFYDGEYNKDGEIVIYGKGDMPEYGSIVSALEGKNDNKLPAWWLLSATYDSIVVDTGITKISENAFAYACEYVTSVKVSKNCVSIEKNSFLGGSEIKTVYLPASLEYISADAFPDSTDVTIMFEGTAEEFSKVDTGNLSYSAVVYNVSY